MPKYLKDYVTDAGGTLLLQIQSIGSVETNKWNKQVCRTMFLIKSTGMTIGEDILAVKFQKYDLKGAKVGDNVEAYIKDSFLSFRKIQADAEWSEPLTQTPSQQVQAERKASESVVKEEAKWDKIALSKIVHEYMKAAMALGKNGEEAAVIAKAFTRHQFTAVEELWAERTQA